MLYRVAIQINTVPPSWQWKSTPLSSLNTLLQWLQFYRAFPHDRLRIFSSCSREEMNQQLVQENQGLLSSSVTATQFLQERMLAPRGNERTPSIAIVTEPELRQNSRGRNVLNGVGMSALERRRLELECGPGADHDLPYYFAFPHVWPQARAWTELLVQVQRGELQL
jgi:hypothetical protein